MRSELDNIKSTITISLGTKNRLRKLKGGKSYEDFINYLIRIKTQSVHKLDNTIEFQKFERKKGIYHWYMGHVILFSFNTYNNSQNYNFDISIDTIRHHGKKVTLAKLIDDVSKKKKWSSIETEYRLYFGLLNTAIKQGIDSLFHHKGRIEDYYLWNEEFIILNLPEKSFEEDVMDKLKDFESGVGVFS